VNVTGSNAVLPNRPILDVAFDPTTTTAPKGYAAVGGFNANTPTTPGHVFQVVCTANCAAFVWSNKTGNLPDIPVDSIIANPKIPQQVFAGTDFGLYYTNDITAASPAWQRFENGLPHAMIWDMQIDRGSTTLSLWTRSRGAYVWPLPSALLTPVSVVSRKVHGTAGQKDILLPLTGTRGVECRTPGQTGTTGVDYKVVFTFVNNIVSCGTAGTTGGTVVPGPAANQCTENLNGLPDQQYTTIALNGVLDANGSTGDVFASMGLLVGDVNANGLVNSTDTSQVQAQSGQPVTGDLGTGNYRKDVNANGLINSTDTSTVQSKSGHGLPTPP
jgi:hypothetical protein